MAEVSFRNGSGSASGSRLGVAPVLSTPFIASGPSWTLGKGSRPENARRWPIVTVSIDQVPSEHHGMVLMHGVVAMGGVPSDPVSESNEDPNFVSWAQNHNILPGYFVRRRRFAVPGEDLEFLHVNMDRMGPAAATIFQGPDLSHALLRVGADFVYVEELPVDSPGALAPFENPPSLCNHLAQIDRREFAQFAGYPAVVGRVAIHIKPQDGVPNGKDLSRRAASAGLLQAILEEKLISDLVVGEVDDHIHTIRDPQLDALNGERRGQQVSVVGNQGKQFAGLARLALAQEELVEARRPSVQETEAVLASSDLEERLDHAIHREFVAQDAIKIEGIEEHLTIRSERFIRESQGNVEVAARQSETRVPIFLVA